MFSINLNMYIHLRNTLLWWNYFGYPSVCSSFTIPFSISSSISGLIFLCRLRFPHLFHLSHSYLGVSTGKNRKPLPCTTAADAPSLCCKSNCHFSGTFCNPAQWQHEQRSRSGKVPLSMVLTHAIYLFTGRMKQCNTVPRYTFKQEQAEYSSSIKKTKHKI